MAQATPPTPKMIQEPRKIGYVADRLDRVAKPDTAPKDAKILFTDFARI